MSVKIALLQSRAFETREASIAEHEKRIAEAAANGHATPPHATARAAVPAGPTGRRHTRKIRAPASAETPHGHRNTDFWVKIRL